MIRHVFYSSTRISVYERLRESWSQRGWQDPGLGDSGKQQHASGQTQRLLPKLVMGAIAGATGQLVAVPADLVKV